jgi:dTDP-4-dehydrorhamnose reductase
VTGAGGMLGQDVLRRAEGSAVGLTRADLDVTDRDAVRVAIGPGDVVINCAAWTDVDGAESHSYEAMRVNADGARNVAEAAGKVIYLSSDYVFDGTKDGPYVESDPVNPISEYGRSKAAGERATLEVNPRSHVVRTSWLFGAGGSNFIATMLRLGAERDSVNVVDDQVGQPTYTGHLAYALLDLTEIEDFGVHHVTGQGSCSWYDLARYVFESAGVDCEVEPCTTAEFPRPAPRPANSVLESERRARRPWLPRWERGVDEYLATLGVRA